jgi:hypothetical protein
MLDVFSPLTPDAQRSNRAAYRQHLVERDGLPDIETLTLPRREEGMARYAKPLSRVREIDRPLFLEQYAHFNPRGRLSPEALLLMALVKLNAAEHYGVTQTFEMVRDRALSGEDDVELLLLIEETYHTRILLSSAPLWGLDIDKPSKPPLFLQGLIVGIVRGPELLSRPLVLASEVVATVMCLNLLHAAGDILKHDPELRDAIEERIMEVLIDEIGHVSFNRMLLGPAGLTYARWLLPMVAEGTARMMPVLGAIGPRLSARGAATVTTSAGLPEAVRKAAFVA